MCIHDYEHCLVITAVLLCMLACMHHRTTQKLGTLRECSSDLVHTLLSENSVAENWNSNAT